MVSTGKSKDNILVVDDIATSLQLLASLLVKNGYNVQTAKTGELALEAVYTAAPDLILLDIRMPGIDGYEVCQRLKADEQTHDIPIIFISALEDLQDKVKGFAVGGVDYITKPFQAEEVLARVKTHLALRRVQKESEAQNAQLVQEIADRMQAEEGQRHAMAEVLQATHALEESEKRYRWLVEHASDIIYRYEYIPQPGFTYVSPAITALTGYTPEEHYTDPQVGEKIIHPDDQRLWKALTEGRITPDANITFRWVHKDGEIIWTEHSVTPVYDPLGNLVAAQGIARDITATKQAEESLRYQAFLLDNVSDAIISSDINFKIQSWNRAAETIYGWRADEVIGRPFLEVLRPEHLHDPQELMAQFLKDGYWKGEAVHRRKDGTPIHVLDSVTLLRDAEGNPIGGVSANRDITERKRAEMEAERRAAHTSLIYEVGQRVSGKLKLEALLPEIVTSVRDAFDYYNVSLFLLNEQAQHLTLQSIAGGYADKARPDDFKIPIGTGMIGYAAATSETQLSGDVNQNPYYARTADGTTKSELAVPVKSGQQVIGVLDLQSNNLQAFDETDVILMETLSDQIGAAIENARLYEAVQSELAERKRAEEGQSRALAEALLATRAMQESEEKFRSVIEQANDGIVLTDERGAIIEWNYGQEQITGIKRDQVLGQSLWSILGQFENGKDSQNTQMPKRVQQNINEFLTTRQAPWMNQLQEWEIERADGQRRFVQTVPFPIETAKGMLMGSVMRDITEQKQAEQALKQANVDLAARVDELAMLNLITQTVTTVQNLSAILDTIAEVMADFFDAQRTVIALLNTAQTELVISAHHFSQPALTSHGEGETQGDNLTDLAQPLASIPQVVERRQPIIISQSQTDQPTRPIRDIMQAQGVRSLMIIPLQARGQAIGIVAVATDQAGREFTPAEMKLAETIAGQVAGAVENARLLDEQQKAKEQALTAQQAAEAANRAKSAFLANMSHELRTPLNAILGFTQLLVRDPTITDRQRENLKTITQSGDHLLLLINDVLEMSKIEAGRTTLSEQDFDLHRLLSTLREMFHLAATDKGLRLDFDQAPNTPQYVRADEGKLRQVLINLLSNAVKFTRDGCVTLQVNYEQAPPRLLFEVRDTGPGIPQDDIAKLFDPFVKTVSGQEFQEGTGLGLPISQRFANMMGGDLTVISPPSEGGPGSVFKFDVPIQLAESIDAPAPQTAEQPMGHVIGLVPGQQAADGGPYRLLVVEDRKTNRQVLVELLLSLNYPPPDGATDSRPSIEVRQASNGREAIQIWEEWEPHLIWMDMRMPVMDGYEATRRIKATDKGQDTIIIALTANTLEKDRAAILAEGCDDFIGKPFRETDIFDKLKHLDLRFMYQDEGDSQTIVDTGQPQDTMTDLELAERLMSLPSDWVSDLQQAAVLGSLDSILVLVEKIRELDTLLANALENLAHNFEHDKIIVVTQQAEKQRTASTH